MKKALVTCLLIIAMVTLLCVPAFAAAGELTIQVGSDYLDNDTVTIDGSAYDTGFTSKGNGEYTTEVPKFDLTFKKGGSNGTEYTIYVVKDGWQEGFTAEQMSNQNKIVYVNQVQVSSTAATVTFSEVSFAASNDPLYVYIAGSGIGRIQVATITYVLGVILGDVDGNTLIQAADSLAVLRYIAGYIPLDDRAIAAADTNDNKLIQANDSLNILRHIAGYVDLSNGYVK